MWVSVPRALMAHACLVFHHITIAAGQWFSHLADSTAGMTVEGC